MKTKLEKKEIVGFIDAAIEGSGRETEIGGDNFQVDMTIIGDDIPNHPELAGGTVRVFLNKWHKYIGHKILRPRKKMIK